MASPRPPPPIRLSQAEQMEISLLIRRVEFLEARAEALDTLRQRISTCTSQLAYFQLEVERLQKVCDSLQSADNNTLHRLRLCPQFNLSGGPGQVKLSHDFGLGWRPGRSKIEA